MVRVLIAIFVLWALVFLGWPQEAGACEIEDNQSNCERLTLSGARIIYEDEAWDRTAESSQIMKHIIDLREYQYDSQELLQDEIDDQSSSNEVSATQNMEENHEPYLQDLPSLKVGLSAENKEDKTLHSQSSIANTSPQSSKRGQSNADNNEVYTDSPPSKKTKQEDKSASEEEITRIRAEKIAAQAKDLQDKLTIVLKTLKRDNICPKLIMILMPNGFGKVENDPRLFDIRMDLVKNKPFPERAIRTLHIDADNKGDNETIFLCLLLKSYNCLLQISKKQKGLIWDKAFDEAAQDKLAEIRARLEIRRPYDVSSNDTPFLKIFKTVAHNFLSWADDVEQVLGERREAEEQRLQEAAKQAEEQRLQKAKKQAKQGKAGKRGKQTKPLEPDLSSDPQKDDSLSKKDTGQVSHNEDVGKRRKKERKMPLTKTLKSLKGIRRANAANDLRKFNDTLN